MVSSGPPADDNPDPACEQFVAAYRDLFPDGLPSPSLVAHAYYMNMKAALLALNHVGCDLSDGQARFNEVLCNLEFDSPTGPVRLDHTRAAIATIYVTQVARQADGTLGPQLIKSIPNVNSTLGVGEDEYLGIGPFTADNPECP